MESFSKIPTQFGCRLSKIIMCLCVFEAKNKLLSANIILPHKEERGEKAYQ